MTLTRIIVFPSPQGTGICDFAMIAHDLDLDEVKNKYFPEITEFFFTTNDKLPEDIYYRNSWLFNPTKITIDIERMKELAHTIRRRRRDEEFEPFDKIIARQIPGAEVEGAELKSLEIREKYTQIQIANDNETSYLGLPAEVKTLKAV